MVYVEKWYGVYLVSKNAFYFLLSQYIKKYVYDIELRYDIGRLYFI